MNLEKNTRNNLIKYFALTYLLFWILIGVIGILMLLGAPMIVIEILKNVIAWTPTFVLLILFRKLYPDMTFKKFFVEQINRKIKPIHLVLSLVLQIAILAIGLITYSLIAGTSIQIKPLVAIIPLIFINLTSGPMGEELGWRSYALQTLQKKYNPLQASLILGLVWCFWHLPLWLASGYTGLDLVFYSLAFLGGVLALSIITTYFYNKNRNVLTAVWIHFWFNFLLSILAVESKIFLRIFYYIVLFYILAALILVIVKKSEFQMQKLDETPSQTE